MKSIEWLDRLIAEKGLPSDRQAALMIGMSAQVMSSHRTGRLKTLDDKYAYALEEALGLPHGAIIADQHAEREADPAIKMVWHRLAATAGGLALCALSGVAQVIESVEYILCKIGVVNGQRRTRLA